MSLRTRAAEDRFNATLKPAWDNSGEAGLRWKSVAVRQAYGGAAGSCTVTLCPPAARGVRVVAERALALWTANSARNESGPDAGRQ